MAFKRCGGVAFKGMNNVEVVRGGDRSGSVTGRGKGRDRSGSVTGRGKGEGDRSGSVTGRGKGRREKLRSYLGSNLKFYFLLHRFLSMDVKFFLSNIRIIHSNLVHCFIVTITVSLECKSNWSLVSAIIWSQGAHYSQ